jgi:predicted transcriptional regulator
MNTKRWRSVRAARLSPEARARVSDRARAELEKLTLRELRQGLALTQQEVADKADMTQSELSRLESRGDLRLSTLRRYVEALGGELEISVVVGKRRHKLADIG